MSLTTQDVGLLALAGSLAIAVGNSSVQVCLTRRTLREQRSLAEQDRMWRERADSYVSWLVQNDEWRDYREAALPVVVVAGEVPVTLPSDFFSSSVARTLHARLSAFASTEVRTLIEEALVADKGFTYAVFMRRDHLARSDGRQGAAGESLATFEVLEKAKARAREADEAVEDRMRAELHGGLSTRDV